MFSWLKKKYHIMRWKQLRRYTRYSDKEAHVIAGIYKNYPYIENVGNRLKGDGIKYIIELEGDKKLTGWSAESVMEQYFQWLARKWEIQGEV